MLYIKNKSDIRYYVFNLKLLIMKNIKKKFVAFSLVIGLSMGVSLIVKTMAVKENQIWLGVGFAASKAGYSAEANLGIGVVGLAQTALWGSAAGPAGTIMGVVFGA